MEKTIESFDGTYIWYRSIGRKGAPIILCDGLGCDGFIWKYFIEDFAPTYRLFHWNYRSHGFSSQPKKRANLGIEANVRDLQNVIADSGIRQKIILAGHSLGVQVALEYYRQFPNKVVALLIFNGSYGHVLSHVHNTDLLKKSVPGLSFFAKKAPKAVQFAWKNIFGSAVAPAFANLFEINASMSSEEDVAPYFRHLKSLNPEIFFETLARVADHTVEDFLPKIAVPTMITASEKDKFTPFRFSRRMHRLIPDSELLLLPNGSHIGMLEFPEIVNTATKKFLATHLKKKVKTKTVNRSH